MDELYDDLDRLFDKKSELLDKKEEITYRIKDLKVEKSMGIILGELDDEDMAGKAEREIKELQQKLVEIDRQIKFEERKQPKKKELRKKYPDQGTYFRVMTMSQEELQEYANVELSKIRKKKAELTAEKEELEAKRDEAKQALFEIRDKIKITHDFDSLQAAEQKKKDYDNTQKAISQVEKELSEVGPTEFDLEEFRQGMIENLKGYKKPGSDEESVYIEKGLEEGLSLEEIAKELTRVLIDMKIPADMSTYGVGYTVESVENYLIEKEFFKELEAIAAKKSQEAKERILNKSSDSDINKMFEENTEVKEEGKTY